MKFFKGQPVIYRGEKGIIVEVLWRAVAGSSMCYVDFVVVDFGDGKVFNCSPDLVEVLDGTKDFSF